MISHDLFGKNVSAHCQYAQALEHVEREQVLTQRLEDRSWLSAPVAWFNLAYSLKDDGRRRHFGDLAAEQITSGPLDEDTHRLLGELWRHAGLALLPHAQQLLDWLAAHASPGDASLVADVLEYVWQHQSPEHDHEIRHLPDWTVPAARWLLENGSAELRTDRRTQLIPMLIDVVHRHADDSSLLKLALRYALRRGPALFSWYRDSVVQVWRAMETLLADPNTDASLARDLISSSLEGARGGREQLHPLYRPEMYPLSRSAVLLALGDDLLPDTILSEAWWQAMVGAVPESLHCESLSSLREGLQRLGDRVDSQSNWDAEGWTRLLTAEFLRWHERAGGFRRRDQVRHFRAFYRDELAGGMLLGIRDALDGRNDDATSLARAIVGDEEVGSSARVLAALEAWPCTERASDVEPTTDLVALATEFTRLVNLPDVQGARVPLASLIGEATRVEFADLEEDEKVRLSGNRLLLNRGEYEHAPPGFSPEERLALFTVYFLHELVHVGQGIGSKDVVADVRATGAETTLMHLDLAADHIAACMAARAYPHWSLAWLKDLQGRSLVSYPVREHHTAAARARKATRLIGLRVDWLVRTAPRFEEHVRQFGDAYFFADYGPAGGRFLLLHSGPPFSVVERVSLEAVDAAILAGAADEGRLEAGLGETDQVLRGLLKIE